MFVFIDESGDTSVKPQTQSTHFTLAMVIFNNEKDVIASCNLIGNLKHEINNGKEFKFSATSNRCKDSFFKNIKCLNFKVRSMTIEKTPIIGRQLAFTNSQLYNNWLRMFISRAPMENARVVIDEGCNEDLPQLLKHYYSSYRPDKIQTINTSQSIKCHCLQLADMVTGAVARFKTSQRNNADKWFKEFADKIIENL